MMRFLDLFRRTVSKSVDSSEWIRASSRVLTGRAQPPAFSPEMAVRSYASWVFAAANINGNAVASTPLRLYVRSSPATRKLWNTRKPGRKSLAYLRGDGRHMPSPTVLRKAAEIGSDFEEVTDDHPMLRLLARSNPYTNGYDLTVLRVVWQELTGNAYMHVVTGALGVPSELWPMPPQWTTIKKDEADFIAGYLYGASSERTVEFTPEEVIHFKRPNPRDLWYGMGKLEGAWGAAMANAALHDMDYSMFKNHARPDYLMTVKGNASADEIDRLEAGIQNKLRGTRKAGSFLITTNEIDLKPLQFAPKDMNGRDEIVEEIAAVFGVPVSMLKSNDPNLASATIGFASWREMTILPLCRMDEEVLNQRLLPMFGLEGEAVLAYDDPVPSNRQLEITETQVSVAGGWMTPNEARAANGLDPSDDPMADRLMVNGQPLGGPMAASPLAAAASPSVPPVTTGPTTPAPQTPAAPVQTTAATPDATKADDCVSDKIRTLLAEGYPREQAIAIAIDHCGKSKAIEDVDTVPPQSVADNARRALEVRADKPESQRGMTAVGIARARDLSNRVALSEDTIRRMAAYFERHQSDKQGETWDEQGPGWQAWHGWGGDEGWSWARRKVEEFDRQRERSGAKSCGCGCGRECDQKSAWLDGSFSASDVHTKAETGELVDDKALRKLVDSVDEVFRAQIQAVVDAIKREKNPTPDTIDAVLAIMRQREYDVAMRQAFAPYIEASLYHGHAVGMDRLAKIAGSPAVATLGWSSAELDDYVQRTTTVLSTRATTGMNTTRTEAVADLLRQGLQKGETVGELATRVQTWAFGEDDERSERWRAMRVARTEAAFAASTSEQDAWRSTGLVKGKTWILAPDPCEFCEAVAKRFAKNGVGLDEPFYRVGDTVAGADGGRYKLNYEAVDGPPLHPNCRCATQPVLVDDYEDIAREAERRVSKG